MSDNRRIPDPAPVLGALIGGGLAILIGVYLIWLLAGSTPAIIVGVVLGLALIGKMIPDREG
jgi:hypothetical protein